jgi:hypothetical protein
MARSDAIEPMALANMRANGVRSLIVHCGACPRTVVFVVWIFDWLDALTHDCPRKRAASVSDQCHARCPDLPEVV